MRKFLHNAKPPFFKYRFTDLCHINMIEEKLSPSSNSNFRSISAYNQSKLCCSLFSNALNWRLSRHGIMCNAVHPGNMVSSNLSQNWWFYRLLFTLVRPFTKSLVSNFLIIILLLKFCKVLEIHNL